MYQRNVRDPLTVLPTGFQAIFKSERFITLFQVGSYIDNFAVKKKNLQRYNVRYALHLLTFVAALLCVSYVWCSIDNGAHSKKDRHNSCTEHTRSVDDDGVQALETTKDNNKEHAGKSRQTCCHNANC